MNSQPSIIFPGGTVVKLCQSISSLAGPSFHKAFQPLASSGFCWLPLTGMTWGPQKAPALRKIIWRSSTSQTLYPRTHLRVFRVFMKPQPFTVLFSGGSEAVSIYVQLGRSCPSKSLPLLASVDKRWLGAPNNKLRH